MMTGPEPGPARLDVALAARGLARSRAHAARLISAGQVTIDGRRASRAAERVGVAARIEVLGDGARHVSRGAVKLAAALDAFKVDPAGRDALDVGASTGGFTQVLLERGARRVIALDVGHGQLAPELAADARVTSVEGVNARELSADRLDGLSGHGAPAARSIELVTGDLSFIPLGLVLPALRATVHSRASFLLLIKPQFEVGRTGVRGGVVRDPLRVAEAVLGVLHRAAELGLGTSGVIPSPIEGTHGNREYLVWLTPGQPGEAETGELRADAPAHPSQWEARIRRMTKGADA